jgi:hypothetical protein
MDGQAQVNWPHVYVMMTTYNGEKYLAEQIHSILNQVDVEVTPRFVMTAHLMLWEPH